MQNCLRVLAFALLSWASCTTAQAISMDEVLMPGQVIQGHAKEEAECTKCHKKFDKAAQTGLCKECHKDVAGDISEKRGYHGRFKDERECKECHTEHKGRKAHIVILDVNKFDHVQTDFQLRGGHLNAKVKCKDCHGEGKKFRDASSVCYSCHKKDDKHKGGLGNECASCHEEKDWKTTRFDHDKTNFKLLGKHVDVKCKSCHIEDKFKDTPKVCNSCHKKDDDKKHKGNFGSKCESCHVEKDWKEITFSHDKDTKYSLRWKHRDVKCTSCHKGNIYKEKLKQECVSCHQKDDDKKHKGSFGSKCESCHVEKDWKEIPFNHDKDTKYPLRWKHRDVKCTSCHKGDIYKDKLKQECVSCHQKDDDKKHKGSFGSKCESCHVEKDWKEITFSHDRDTKYPLRWKHRDVKCTSCHKGDIYKDKLESYCFACHEKDDKHKGQEGKKCESCHSEQSWTKADFDHQKSHFPLTGKHVKVECKKCHLSPAFKDARSDCLSCHEKDDTHKRRFGTECENCHSTSDWKKWQFDHDKTSFKLETAHKNIACYKCHTQPMSKKVYLTTSCYSCHDADDVHHGEFGPQCERCHVGSTWRKIRVGGKMLQ